MTTTGGYVYRNAGAAANIHHDLLAAICNPGTVARLSGLRVDLWGARCLEVGAGGGTIASWLAEQVGPDGLVLATDAAPMPIRKHPQLAVRQHNIVTEQVPDGPWNLIHVRLLLMHLPQRDEVLGRLATALAPGGALLVEDWDQTWLAGRVLRSPSAAARQLWESFHDALLAVFAQAGVDPGWAIRVPEVMADAGLVDIDANIHTQSWPAGTAGAHLAVSSIRQLRPELRAQGLSDDHLDQVVALTDDPQVMVRPPLMVSTVGYRPDAGNGVPAMTGWDRTVGPRGVW